MKLEDLKNNQLWILEEGFYQGRLKKIKKSPEKLQPLYEGFINALEAIVLSKQNEALNKNYYLIIRIFLSKSTLENEFNFQHIEIEDNGIGFNDDNFKRFFILDDDRKFWNNKGTGRVQYLRYFDNTEFQSTYKDETSSSGYKLRKFHFSEKYLRQNKEALIKHIETKELTATDSKTVVKFTNLLNQKSDYRFYSGLTVSELKQSLLDHYLLYFCDNKSDMPEIKLEEYHDNGLQEKTTLFIRQEDIPDFDNNWPINVSYSKISEEGTIEKDNSSEIFEIKSFVIPKEQLKENDLILTSKGQKVNTKIKLEILQRKEDIKGNRYLFFISGNYLNEKEDDPRGELLLIDRDEFKKRNKEPDLYPVEPEILLDDIQETANSSIEARYEEIQEKKKEKFKKLEELKKMYLLNNETLADNKISVNDTEEDILRKFYTADVKLDAHMDAETKKQIDRIRTELIPSKSERYYENLEKEINEFVKATSIRKRTNLTRYVARRKIVLDLFEDILDKEKKRLKNEGKINESVLHNLIFQQSSDNPEKSDLWLINEDFIYFKGFSETRLCDATIEGEKVFKEEFSKIEQEHIDAFGKKRLTRKPDVLLFPEEGKCIIIEFKRPGTDVTDHLNQIDKYATYIRNFTKDELQIKAFYGYLIGEEIDEIDISVGAWEESYNFNYWFRPSQRVKHLGGIEHGSIYTEVIKYSSHLERAKSRNDIFIKKLNNYKSE